MLLKKDCFQRRSACDNWPVSAKQSYRRSKPLKRTEKTRSEPSTSASRRESDAPLWLQEQVYAPKKQRTTDLVKRSIESLLKERQRISLTSIAAISKTIDPTGQGISESAVLNNEEARTLYEQRRTWK